jgi:CHASE2 domain-containing sensor protein
VTSAVSRVTPRSFLFLVLLAAAGLLLIVAGAVLFIRGPLWLKGAGIGAAAVGSILWWRLNGLMYDRWFDLVSPVRET